MHTALSASHTASGRQDFETETFIVEPVTYSIMPQNSGKDYKAREVDVAQPLMASGPVGGNQGGDYVVQPIGVTVHGTDQKASVASYTDLAGAIGTKPPGAYQNSSTTAVLQPVAAFNLFPAGPDAATHALETDISYALTARGEAAKNGNGLHIAQSVAFSMRGREGGAMPEVEEGDVSPSLRAADGGSTRPFVAFDETQITSKANYSNPKPGDPCHPLAAGARPPTIFEAEDVDGDGFGPGGFDRSDYGGQPGLMAVRRITCVEGERLQGFRDNYTLIDWPTGNRKGEDLAETVSYLIGHGFTSEEAEILAQSPDGPRYKEIGNSKAVPLVRAIGRRYAAALERFLAARVA